MKRIALLISLFALGLFAASYAVAGPPPGKGKDKAKEHAKTSSTSTSLETCKPKISVILKGLFVSPGSDSFVMDVKQANNHGRDYAGKQLTVMVDSKTSYKRKGHAVLEDFVAGDRLNVQARACKLRKGETPPADAAPLLAKRVVGQPVTGSGATTTTTTP